MIAPNTGRDVWLVSSENPLRLNEATGQWLIDAPLLPSVSVSVLTARQTTRKLRSGSAWVTESYGLKSFGEKFGALVRKYRESAGLSGGELAIAAFNDEAKKSRISDLENGKVKRPQAKTTNALAKALGIPDYEIDEARKPEVISESEADLKINSEAKTLMIKDLQAKLKVSKAELAEALKSTTDPQEQQTLQAQIAELQRRLADPDKAFAEEKERLASIQSELDSLSNEVGSVRLNEAKAALENDDTQLADQIFAEVEEAEELALNRVASAAFARGKIAQGDIRWADALIHYKRAAEVQPSRERLHAAREMAWRSGQITQALSWGDPLIRAAIDEFGEGSSEHATALNEHALSLHASGRLEDAEPLYKQAIDIGKATIGEAHPDYAIDLNNLANLFRDMGRLEDAEPLYKQAIDIDKATIGEAHPDYAIHLNNLAFLYHDTGRLAEAAPLYVQAIQILETALGPDHPNTKRCKANYAALLSDMDKAP